MSYTQFFTRCMGNPAIVEESKQIQERKRVQGYDPDLTTTVKGPTISNTKDLWASGPKIQTSAPSSIPAENFFGSQTEVEAKDLKGKIPCSFCKTPTDLVHLTHEKRPTVRFHTELQKDQDTGDMHMVERRKTTVEDVYACPQCCLRIKKPIMVSRV